MSQKALKLCIEQFFKHQTLIKMFHFQTKQYGRHKELDAYLCKFCANFDRFMEVAQGMYGKFNTTDLDLGQVSLLNDLNYEVHLNEMQTKLKVLCVEKSRLDAAKTGMSGLSAIRDEMVADIEQLRYLLRDFN